MTELNLRAARRNSEQASPNGAIERRSAVDGRNLHEVSLLNVSTPKNPVWPNRLVQTWKEASEGHPALRPTKSGKSICGKASALSTLNL